MVRRTLDIELYHGALGAPDPVALHVLDAVRPVQAVQVLKQPVRIACDAQHPLNCSTPSIKPVLYRLFTTHHHALSKNGSRHLACFMGRRTTGWLPRSLLPSMTSSFASTVPSAGHQLTGTSAWYASPFLKSCRKIHCVQR